MAAGDFDSLDVLVLVGISLVLLIQESVSSHSNNDDTLAMETQPPALQQYACCAMGYSCHNHKFCYVKI
jgi:hypothetical protein